MSNWLGDKYEGEHKEGWYHGYGKLHMEDGVVYEGEFVKGGKRHARPPVVLRGRHAAP